MSWERIKELLGKEHRSNSEEEELDTLREQRRFEQIFCNK